MSTGRIRVAAYLVAIDSGAILVRLVDLAITPTVHLVDAALSYLEEQ